MKPLKKHLILLIILVILVTLGLALDRKTQPVQSASGDNVTGWAWGGGDDINASPPPGMFAGNGWISFNCTNTGTCATSDYGVNIDSSTGDFEGHAWAGGGSGVAILGWLSFERSETGNPPSDDPGGGSGGIANLDLQTGQVIGWMRACGIPPGEVTVQCGGDNWDGWIKLGDSTGNWWGTDEAQVEVNLTTKRFSGWAWGSDVGGWISFNVFADECDTNPQDGVIDDPAPEGCGAPGTPMPPSPPVDINFPPTATADLVVFQCCVNSLNPTLYWDYNDPDDSPPGTDSQTAYQLQIASDIGFTNIVIDTGIVDPGSGNSYTPSGEILQFGEVTYYWRVRVRDSNDNWSVGWSDWQSDPDAQFTTKIHAYPDVILDWAPDEPSAGENVSMVDDSNCYDPDGVERECSTASNDSYKWEFSGPSPVNFDSDVSTLTSEEPIVSFSEPGTWVVSLSVTDGDLIDCDITPRSYNINVREPLPWWREIIPRL